MQITVQHPGERAPAELQVRVDDAVVTPTARGGYTRRLDGGTHRLVVSARGMRTERREVQVVPGRAVVEEVRLQPGGGSLQVSVRNPLGPSPANLRVRLDGAPVAGPPAVLDVTPGTHRVEVDAEGFRAASREVLVAPEQTAEVAITLEPVPGSVRVLVTQPGSEVYLDGVRLEGHPPTRGDVSPGEHGVRVTAPGYRTQVLFVRVQPGQETSVQVPELEREGPGPAACPPGRVRTPQTGTQCCFPGQVWAGARCRGVPQCPSGMTLRGETCDPNCQDGRHAMEDGSTCCWQGQALFEGTCRGVPTCPPDRVLRGELCVRDPGPGFFRNIAGGFVGPAYSVNPSEGQDGAELRRAVLTLGFLPGPLELLATGGYAWGSLARRKLSSATGSLLLGVQVFSWPRGDRNHFAPINLSAGLLGDFVLLPDRPGASERFQGRFGFYLAETFVVTCGLALRVAYEHSLVTEQIPSSVSVTLLGVGGRAVCAGP